jgi:cytochrome c2
LTAGATRQLGFRNIFTLRTGAITLAGIVTVIAMACGGGDDDTPTSTPTTLASTPTATTEAPTATATSPSVTGDPDEGEELFTNSACSACHSTGSNTIVGPGLSGVGQRAATRVEGLSADEYIAQSLRQPAAYVVDGFSPIMTSFDYLSAQEIADLTAYLKTLD